MIAKSSPLLEKPFMCDTQVSQLELTEPHHPLLSIHYPHHLILSIHYPHHLILSITYPHSILSVHQPYHPIPSIYQPLQPVPSIHQPCVSTLYRNFLRRTPTTSVLISALCYQRTLNISPSADSTKWFQGMINAKDQKTTNAYSSR